MTMQATVHISSAIVSVLPQYRGEVLRMLASFADDATVCEGVVVETWPDAS
jgi:hypothetical protein